MADTWYEKGAEKFASAGINWMTDTIMAAFVTNAYTFSHAHEFRTSIAASIAGTPWTLTGKSITGGVLDAADTAPAVFAPGSTLKAVVVWKDTGTAATSPLLLYFDSVTGLPMATNGGEINIPWNDGPAKIVSLL